MKKILAKAHRSILGYAVFASPLVLFYMYWFSTHQEQPQDGILGIVNYLAFAWILSLGYLILALLCNSGFREALLTRLAGFKESDEREQIVTARAARATFLFMFAVQLVMLLMTLTQVRVTREERRNPDDKPGVLSVGVRADSTNLDVFPAAVKEAGDPNAVWEWGGRVLPANMTLPALLLVLLQIGAFRLFSTKRYSGLQD